MTFKVMHGKAPDHASVHSTSHLMKAHELSIGVYQATRKFPAEERYGLIVQLRRAACSIEANVAEGAGRRTQAEFRRFLDIASGSASELHCHLLLARDLEMLSIAEAEALIGDLIAVKRMLGALTRRVGSN